MKATDGYSMKTEVFMDERRKEIFMNIIKKFKDNFGNIAAIEQTETFPYRGAGKKTPCFRLYLMAEYDGYSVKFDGGSDKYLIQ